MYIVYRDFITTLIIGGLNYTITQNFTLAGLSLVRYTVGLCGPVYNAWPEAIFVCFTRSTWFTKLLT